jgi:hypothetical protein
VKWYWEIIADNLKKRGWSLGDVAALILKDEQTSGEKQKVQLCISRVQSRSLLGRFQKVS